MASIPKRVVTALLAAGLAAVPLASCLPVVPAGSVRPLPERAVGAVDDRLAREIAAIGTLERAQAGVPALVADEMLDAAARDFAVELARRGRLTHASERSGYRTPVQRVSRVERRPARVAENLAMLSDRADAPREVVRQWLRSRGHRANLLSPEFSRVGTGVAAGARGTWYVVQLYATD